MSSSEEIRAWLTTQTWPDIRAFVDDPANVTYVHPLGFIVCRLTRISVARGWQVRLHLWPTANEQDDLMRAHGTASQQIHCHGWDLKSRVLIGSLRERTFEVKPSAASANILFEADSSYGIGSSVLTPLHPVKISQIGTSVREYASGCLEIPALQYHATNSIASVAASIVATAEKSTLASKVVVLNSEATVFSNPREAADPCPELLAQYDAAYAKENLMRDQWASFAFLVDQDDQILMVRPHRQPDLWQPAGGRSERQDLTPRHTVMREVHEETGIRLEDDSLEPLFNTTRDIGSGRVYFWLARVVGPPPLKLSEELIDARWLPINHLAQLDTYEGTKEALPALQKRLA